MAPSKFKIKALFPEQDSMTAISNQVCSYDTWKELPQKDWRFDAYYSDWSDYVNHRILPCTFVRICNRIIIYRLNFGRVKGVIFSIYYKAFGYIRHCHLWTKDEYETKHSAFLCLDVLPFYRNGCFCVLKVRQNKETSYRPGKGDTWQTKEEKNPKRIWYHQNQQSPERCMLVSLP